MMRRSEKWKYIVRIKETRDDPAYLRGKFSAVVKKDTPPEMREKIKAMIRSMNAASKKGIRLL